MIDASHGADHKTPDPKKPSLRLADWQDIDGGFPSWVMQAYERKMEKSYSQPRGFFTWVANAAVGLYQVVRIKRAHARVTNGRIVADDIAEHVQEAIETFDTDALTAIAQRDGLGAFVKQLPTGGTAPLLAEMNKAIALDRTMHAFANVVVDGKALIDDLEFKGLDPDVLTSIPVDSDEARLIVEGMDATLLRGFKQACADNTKWQHILEGAMATEQHLEALLGKRREDAQNVADFGAPNANDYEDAIDDWIEANARDSTFTWGVLRCKAWPPVVRDFHDQMQWVCAALKTHAQDADTAFYIRPGAIPHKKPA